MTEDRRCPHCFAEAIGNICTNCRKPVDVPRSPQALPLFRLLHNRYIMGAVMGMGGFGITYCAYDRISEVRVAIKECFPCEIATRSADGVEVHVNDDRKSDFLYCLTRFGDETEILRALSGSTSIVRVTDYFNENSTGYMVMEYVDGRNLRSAMQANPGSVSYELAQSVFSELALALKCIHEKGLLHRDISPDNIILLAGNHIKLIDFGAARLVSGSGENQLSVFLKPGYAPIEQYSKSGIQGPWTDIYAFGCTMYAYLTGVKVPESTKRAAEGLAVTPLHKVRNDIPKSFSDILQKSMELDWKKRYQSIDQMLNDISRFNCFSQTRTNFPSIRREEEPKNKTQPLKKLIKKGVQNLNKKTGQEVIIAQFVSGPLNGLVYPFPDNGTLTVGRSAETCQVVLPNINDISRQHCTVVYVPTTDTLLLQDNSTNGTFLANGQRLNKGVPVKLEFGQVFYLSVPEYALRIVKYTEN